MLLACGAVPARPVFPLCTSVEGSFRLETQGGLVGLSSDANTIVGQSHFLMKVEDLYRLGDYGASHERPSSMRQCAFKESVGCSTLFNVLNRFARISGPSRSRS